MKKFKRFLAAFLAVLMIIGTVPITSFAAPASDIPAEMLDNVYLDALAYTGYKVQAQKNDGTIFKKYAWQDCDQYLSGITYDNSFIVNGTETVTDSSTVTGKAPNIARFKETGLCCASYVSYVLFNYLPNIAGIDTSNFEKPSNLKSASSYHEAAEKWVSAGVSERITFTQSSDGKTFKPDEEIPIGSLVVFKNGGEYTHVALYAGEYNGKHFVTHVGNSRGPEIHTIEEMEKGDGMEFVANIYTTTFPKGIIEIYKKDPNGANLSGAYFTATNDETGEQFIIGPTDDDGFADKDEILYGEYTVRETVFPEGYTSSGQSEWHVTVDKTNNGVVTINAVNKPISGNVSLKKTADDGIVDGFKFHIYGTSDVGEKVDEYGTTANGGNLNFNNIYVGTYTIEEVELPDCYIQPEKQTVTVKENQTTPVSFENKLIRGGISGSKVLLESKDNKLGDIDLTGIKFAVVSDNDGKVVVYDANGNANEYNKGQVVAICTTDKDGDFTTANNLLPYGNYTLVELRRDTGVSVGSTYSSANKGSSPYASPAGHDAVLWKEQNISFKIENNETIITVGDKNVNDGKDIGNNDSKGQIVIQKKDTQNVTKQGDAYNDK